LTAADLNGWSAAAKLNLGPRIGLVVDFGGNYGRRRMVPTQYQLADSHPGNFHQHTILFGPEFRVLTGDRFDINVRVLIGAAHEGKLVLRLREPLQQPPDLLGNPLPPVTELSVGAGKPLAAAAGGSIDYRISERWSCRVVQPELVVIHVGGAASRLNLRISTGLVFRFGWF